MTLKVVEIDGKPWAIGLIPEAADRLAEEIREAHPHLDVRVLWDERGRL